MSKIRILPTVAPPILCNVGVKQLGLRGMRTGSDARVVCNSKKIDFANLPEEFPSNIREYLNSVQELNAGSAGKWRARLRSASDGDRDIIFHLFLVDLTVS